MSDTEESKEQRREWLLRELVDTMDDPATELTGSGGLMRQLMSRMVEKSLQTELTQHLGYEHNEVRPGTNARNGGTSKTLKTDIGNVTVTVPRDRDGSFEPKLVKKHQRRLQGFDERIIQLYGKGMTVREIQDFFREAYDADISPTLISRVTDAVLADVEEWRHRRLDEVYPVVWLDGLVVKVKTDGLVQKRTVYIALAINMEGRKEVLGLWMAGAEGAKFWLHVVTEIRNRGVRDVLVVCCDGLKGFPEAIESVFPYAIVQTCIVHMVRNSLAFVAWGTRRAVAKDLKAIYRADTEEQALKALETFEEEWGQRYPSIVRSWRDNWERVSPFFAFPKDIRRVIYTTNAIEALNRQLRKSLKPKGHFPSDDAVLKVLYLALLNAEKKWTMPLQRWDLALQQFNIHFEGRLAL